MKSALNFADLYMGRPVRTPCSSCLASRRLRLSACPSDSRRGSRCVVRGRDEAASSKSEAPPWKLMGRVAQAGDAFDKSADTQHYFKQRFVKKMADMPEDEFDERFALLCELAPGFDKWKLRMREATIVGLLRDVEHIPERMITYKNALSLCDWERVLGSTPQLLLPESEPIALKAVKDMVEVYGDVEVVAGMLESHAGFLMQDIPKVLEKIDGIMTPAAEKETPPGGVSYAAKMLRKDPMFMYAVQSGSSELGPATVRGQYGPAMYM